VSCSRRVAIGIALPERARFQPVGKDIFPRAQAKPSKLGSEGSFFVIRLDRLCHSQSQVAEFLAQGLPRYSQQAGGLMLVTVAVLQNAGQQEPAYLAVGLGVEILSIRHEPRADKRFRPERRQ
jgi:hypothetical protein